MNIYENPNQRRHYVEKSILDIDYKQKIRDSLSPGRDNDAMVLTEEFSIISFRTVTYPSSPHNHKIEVNIYGYNPKNLIISKVEPSSRDYIEQKLAININGRTIRFYVATADKLFNQSSVLNEINFKMRKLLLKIQGIKNVNRKTKNRFFQKRF